MDELPTVPYPGDDICEICAGTGHPGGRLEYGICNCPKTQEAVDKHLVDVKEVMERMNAKKTNIDDLISQAKEENKHEEKIILMEGDNCPNRSTDTSEDNSGEDYRRFDFPICSG